MALPGTHSIVKPIIQTPFYIDFNWWSQSEHNWKVILTSYLSPEHQQALAEMGQDETFDLIDPKTAEVRQVEALQYLLMTHYANRSEFITESSSLVESIFRLLLANGNRPMTPEEMTEKLGRSPQLILQILAGKQIYRGLRPYVPHP